MAMGRNGLSWVLVLALGLGLAACGDDDDHPTADAGPDGSVAGNGGKGGSSGKGGAGGSTAGKGGMGGSAGAAGSAGSAGSAGTMAPPPLECGSETCAAIDPMAAGIGVTACCTSDNKCGLKTPLTTNCLPANGPGGVDLSCPTYDVMGAITWYGCCTPAGTCGAEAGGNFGCIPNDELMAPAQSCNYDPQNTCERLIDVACDGNEDCPGQKCCGVYDSGYRKFVCADDCAASQQAEGGTWSEACHPGESCTTDGYSCYQNTDYLPDFLFRCRDTGMDPVNTGGSVSANEVNCGDSVCGAGKKCCVSVPGQAVCVPKDQDCTCVPEGADFDAGTEDAGK